MLPDYPHKLFPDKRNEFVLLMETLAMDTPKPCLAGRQAFKGGLGSTLKAE